MKRFLPVLAVLAWLGLSISSAQVTQHRDPFDRYLAAVRVHRPEPSLVRFADECGVKFEQREPKFAVSSAPEWSPVKDLAVGIKNLDSDNFSTAQATGCSWRFGHCLWMLARKLAFITALLIVKQNRF